MDDSHRLRIDTDGELPPLHDQGENPYDAGFRRIVTETELAPGRARIFETGGSFVLVARDGGGTRAFDAQPLIVHKRSPHLLHTEHFMIETTGSPGPSQPLKPLPVVIQDSWIWVDAEEHAVARTGGISDVN